MSHNMVFASEDKLQQKVIKGANILADNVASTLGPRGRTVLLQEKGKTPFVSKDGITVAHFVHLDDPFENAGAQLIKQAAVETNGTAGDGTTTSTVLARSILVESQRYILAGSSPTELQRDLQTVANEVVANLSELTYPIKSIEDIKHIATISANNDEAIGDLISLAVDRVGQDGAITIEESRSIETSLDVVEGFRFEGSYAAGAFINDERRAIMYYEEPLFLITDHKLESVSQADPNSILSILQVANRTGRPIIFIAEEIEGQALASLIYNAVKRKETNAGIRAAAIKISCYGEERRAIMEDLALSVGATFITRESGMQLKDAKLEHLGSAKSIESTIEKITIVGGTGDYERIEEQIGTFKALIEQSSDLSFCERIQDRIVRLSSGVAVIKVGGSTEVEMIERKHRIEDALEAVRSAQEEGIVGGGGTALLRASLRLQGDSEAHAIIKRACQAPIRKMAENSGLSPDIIVKDVLESSDQEGWDFKQNCLSNMLESGIIDPVKVSKTALLNAVSCAGTLITTNYGIIQVE